MSDSLPTAPRIPPMAMARYGTHLVVRLLLACVFGLLVAKGLQWSGIESDKATLKIVAHVACWGGLLISFFIRGVGLPAVDYGPEGQPPSGLLDFLDKEPDRDP